MAEEVSRDREVTKGTGTKESYQPLESFLITVRIAPGEKESSVGLLAVYLWLAITETGGEKKK